MLDDSPVAEVATRRLSLPYMPQLDGLRALAVVAVMLEHWPPVPRSFLSRLPMGELGVQLFFVLSGFLITAILLQCRDLVGSDQQTALFTLRQFYARRFLRIFPLYYATLAVAALFDLEDVRNSLFYSISYLYNFYKSSPGVTEGPAGHFWSLAVEEQFYLVWPFIILFTPKQRLVPVMIATVAFGPAYRLATTALKFDWQVRLYPAFGCLDSLGMGSLLALCNHDLERLGIVRRKVLGLGAWLGGPLLVFCCVVNGSGRTPPGLDSIVLRSASALFFVWLIARAAEGFGGPIGGWLSSGPMVYLGKISYGLYVIHNFVPDLLAPLVGTRARILLATPLGRFSAYTVATIAIASLSWVAFERPLNGLKRYFPYERER